MFINALHSRCEISMRFNSPSLRKRSWLARQMRPRRLRFVGGGETIADLADRVQEPLDTRKRITRSVEKARGPTSASGMISVAELMSSLDAGS
jgi:hypothetical protein